MLSIGMVMMDCEDPAVMAEFWRQALGTEVAHDSGDVVVLAGSPGLGLHRVEDRTPGKNRLHLEFYDEDRTHAVARLVELGAEVVRTHDVEGYCWTVMADPEGNQFCVSDPPERAEGPHPGEG